MKKLILCLFSAMLLVSAVGCSSPTATDSSSSQASASNPGASKNDSVTDSIKSPVVVKTSPDKYTWYIKDYVNKNVASFGYLALNGMRMDSYGSGYMKLVFVTDDGHYVDIEDDETLKQYVVCKQSLAPNTEIKYTFQKDSEGNEYDNLIDAQNIDEIVLGIKKVGSSETFTKDIIEITPSPDKYTYYVKDYVGRNLSTCGYISLLDDYRDTYGPANVQLIVTGEDGSYIDVTDEDQLKNYVVTAQSIAPNTEFTLTMMVDSSGNEYSNLVQTQGIESIDLYVVPIAE